MADQRRQGRIAKAGVGAALVSAFTASLCCIGPIAAATLGLTSLGALARFEALRPWFTALTLVFLLIAFFLSYRRRPGAECAPGSLCEAHGETPVRRVNRIVLWIAAILAVVVLTFPSWSAWVLG